MREDSGMGNDPQSECYRDEINLYDLWLVLKKRWFIVLIVVFFTTGLAISYILLTPKVYRVSNILVLNQIHDGDIIEGGEIASAASILLKSQQYLNDLPGIQDTENLIERKEVAAAISVLDQVKDRDISMPTVNDKALKKIRSIKTSEIKGSTGLWVDIETTDRQAGVAAMESLPEYIFFNPNIYGKIILQKSILLKNRDDLKSIIMNPVRGLKLSPNTVVYLPSIDLYTLQEKYNCINAVIDKMDKGKFITLAWKTKASSTPYKPMKMVILSTGLAAGFFLGLLIIFFIEWVKKNRDAHLIS
jgi:uncharacterized protein involved in exopolysaccharide biosynthesis